MKPTASTCPASQEKANFRNWCHNDPCIIPTRPGILRIPLSEKLPSVTGMQWYALFKTRSRPGEAQNSAQARTKLRRLSHGWMVIDFHCEISGLGGFDGCHCKFVQVVIRASRIARPVGTTAKAAGCGCCLQGFRKQQRLSSSYLTTA